jgi:hypothetical protein
MEQIKKEIFENANFDPKKIFWKYFNRIFDKNNAKGTILLIGIFPVTIL